MRTQVAVYLHPDTKRWLKQYGNKFGMTQSEVARALVERGTADKMASMGAGDPGFRARHLDQ